VSTAAKSFPQSSGSSPFCPSAVALKCSITPAYDLNGNATSIVRKGMDMVSGLVPAPWSPLAMVTGTIPLWCTTDSMSLAYEGNRLVSVSDEGRQLLGADLFGFSDGADALVEYEYDENGNTVKDLNRKISSIQYNSLNLRQRREDGGSNQDSIEILSKGEKGKNSFVGRYSVKIIKEKRNGCNYRFLILENDSTYIYCVEECHAKELLMKK